jgi:CspA family cold shock protein
LRQTGKVKWFNENKGYGFILQQEGGRDVFVHYSEIKEDGYRTLSEGELVEFDVAESPKGPQAKDVVRNGSNQPAPPAPEQ